MEAWIVVLASLVIGASLVLVGAMVADGLRHAELQRLRFYDELDEIARRGDAGRAEMVAHAVAIEDIQDLEHYRALEREAAMDEACDDCCLDCGGCGDSEQVLDFEDAVEARAAVDRINGDS